jgi:predicted P-loop ATPase
MYVPKPTATLAASDEPPKANDNEPDGPTKQPANSHVAQINDAAESLKQGRNLSLQSFPDAPHPGHHKLPATIENVEHILATAGIKVRYNVIKKKVEVDVPDHTGTSDNHDNVTRTKIVSLAASNGIPTGLVPSYIEAIGDRNAYNPVKDWIASKPWDGIDRLPDFCATVIEREGFPRSLKDALIGKWLLSAVAAAVMPTGFRSRGVLTLQGPQGIGKTSWAMALVSEPALRADVVKLDHHLDTGNKDTIISAVSHWIVEIGELDSSFKKDVARLKGFITAGFDKVRRPYAHTDAEYQRRTVFLATVNDSNFLVDTTGNNRWWTIPVDRLAFDHAIDMQQLYAQLALALPNGAEWWLTPAEEQELDQRNVEHRSVSVIRDALLERLDHSEGAKTTSYTAMQVLAALGFRDARNPDFRECGGILREMYGEPKRINGQMKWRIPLTNMALVGPRVTADDVY